MDFKKLLINAGFDAKDVNASLEQDIKKIVEKIEQLPVVKYVATEERQVQAVRLRDDVCEKKATCEQILSGSESVEQNMFKIG